MIGTDLQLRRQDLGMTQTEIAKSLGLSARTIKRYESSDDIPQWLQIIMDLPPLVRRTALYGG